MLRIIGWGYQLDFHSDGMLGISNVIMLEYSLFVSLVNYRLHVFLSHRLMLGGGFGRWSMFCVKWFGVCMVVNVHLCF